MNEPSAKLSPSSRRAISTAAAAFLLCAVPVAFASHVLSSQEDAARAAETAMMSEQAALRLAEFVRARFLALEIVRREAADPEFRPNERFDSLATATNAQYGGFQAINWIDAAGVIRRVVPREPNLAALDRSVLEYAPAHDAVERAFSTLEPQATPPIDLLQGGRGFASYFPVVRDGELIGMINGVFRVDDLVEGCLGGALLERYETVIDDDGSSVYGDASIAVAGARDHTLSVLDRTWRLRLGPRARPADSIVSQASFLAVGLFFSVGLATAAYLVTRRGEARVAAEREQRRLESRLASAERLEGIGRLAGGVAHDFNNLLAVILAATDRTMLARIDLPRAARESLEDANTAAERAAGLTRQLLAFSREQPRDVRRLDFADIVRSTERILRRLVREDIEFCVSVPEGEAVWITSDAAQLTQVIVNLVVNAADAVAARGHIDVTLCVRDGVSPKEPSGRWAVLEVRDDGTGIAAEDLERIFEPFFSTKSRDGRGTGLGLATVHALMQAHEGHVIVESAVGMGTVFRTFFPLISASEVAGVSVAIEVPRASAAAAPTVLLVEDSVLLRRATSRSLEALGYTVAAATDGADALGQLDAGLMPALILSDVVMPRMGGLDLLRAIRARGRTVPVILSSGYADVDVPPDEIAALHVRFLAKPFSIDQLEKVTREALESSR